MSLAGLTSCLELCEKHSGSFSLLADQSTSTWGKVKERGNDRRGNCCLWNRAIMKVRHLGFGRLSYDANILGNSR